MGCHRRAVVAWTSATAGVLAVDYLLARREDSPTLSAATRCAFSTHTRSGRAVFIAAGLVASAVYTWHICWPRSFRAAFSPNRSDPDTVCDHGAGV